MIATGKVLVLDVDGTLCPTKAPGAAYSDLQPDRAMVERIRWFRARGYYIALATSRNMRSYDGNIGLINANTLPELIAWLARHEIPYDELHVGKPWAGEEGFYVDDRAIRPAEFLALSPEEISERLSRDGICDT